MGRLRDRLLGRAAGPRTTTTAPETKSNWEVIAGEQRRAGGAMKDLLAVLRGKQRSPVRVYPQGHLVPDGSVTCVKSHYVG